MPSSRIKAFDFFCGAGGLSRGLSDAGVEVIAGVDFNDRCRLAYERNNLRSKFIYKDINELKLSDLHMEGLLPEDNNVLFAGCAPCQPFSPLRRDATRRGDSTLLRQFGRLVRAAMPGYVLIENVPGIARVRGFSEFQRFLQMLDKLGYNHVHGVIDAQRYGVPQRRRRLILLAARKLLPSLPAPTHGDGLGPIRTVRNAIAGFPPIIAGGCSITIPNHVAARVSELNLERLRATPVNGGDRRSWPPRLRLKCHRASHVVHTDVYGRMFWDRPAPALTSRCISISNGRFGHPEQDRAISLREAAALQSFPNCYEFFGSKKDISLQIGNAVPVKLAEVIGKHFLQMSSYIR